MIIKRTWVMSNKKHFFDKTLKSSEVSAEALYYLGISKEMDGISGKFFNLTTEEEPAPPALDREAATPLWDISLEMAGMNAEHKTIQAAEKTEVK